MIRGDARLAHSWVLIFTCAVRSCINTNTCCDGVFQFQLAPTSTIAEVKKRFHKISECALH